MNPLVKMVLEAAARMLQRKAQAPTALPLTPFVQRTNKPRNLERAAMRAAGGRRQWLKLKKAQRRSPEPR